ncbi:hypothetical protein QFC21_006686 [Naganishia friedmannii]|uniref:Uncharacterized protein n=1 Tax=Naganishia friedmannii TaxID=89922 RepID=A0ACC2V101_9TREE|nr:hypothetical protein QFC21_006686 [Naganishia friedmannii]
MYEPWRDDAEHPSFTPEYYDRSTGQAPSGVPSWDEAGNPRNQPSLPTKFPGDAQQTPHAYTMTYPSFSLGTLYSASVNRAYVPTYNSFNQPPLGSAMQHVPLAPAFGSDEPFYGYTNELSPSTIMNNMNNMNEQQVPEEEEDPEKITDPQLERRGWEEELCRNGAAHPAVLVSPGRVEYLEMQHRVRMPHELGAGGDTVGQSGNSYHPLGSFFTDETSSMITKPVSNENKLLDLQPRESMYFDGVPPLRHPTEAELEDMYLDDPTSIIDPAKRKAIGNRWAARRHARK